MITLMDVWALGSGGLDELDMACWVPVDRCPLPPRVRHFFDATGARPIAMSRFGESELDQGGFRPLYVPHGVDTDVFKPLPADAKAAVRNALELPADAFVVGMVANNQGDNPPRKAFPQVLQVFTAFQQDHPDAILWLHTDAWGKRHGINLPVLAELCGIPDDSVRFTNADRELLGLPPHQMAHLYNAFDVLVNPSYGEGFGVPIIEAQACGTPVVVTDWTSMPELCGAGWLVDGDPWYDCAHGSFFKCPSLTELQGALEQAYQHRRDSTLSASARQFALGYDADRVTEEFWRPALRELEREFTPPVWRELRQENRAMRRAKAAAR